MLNDIYIEIYVLLLYNLIYLYMYNEGSIVYSIVYIFVLIKLYCGLGLYNIYYNNGFNCSSSSILVWIYVSILVCMLLLYINFYNYNSIIYISYMIYLLILNSYNIDIWLISIESLNILTSILLFI